MPENMRIYGKRYCATCEHSKPLDHGKLIDPNGNRWVCYDCKPNVPKRKTTKGRKASALPALRSE
jgi:hypothetical protein